MNCEHEWEQVWFDTTTGATRLVGPFRCSKCRALRPDTNAVDPSAQPQERGERATPDPLALSSGARVDPSPLALLDALLGPLASEQMQHLEAADRYDRAGDTAGNAHAELKAARICREHFEAVMTLRAALLMPTPSK